MVVSLCVTMQGFKHLEQQLAVISTIGFMPQLPQQLLYLSDFDSHFMMISLKFFQQDIHIKPSSQHQTITEIILFNP
ncbi:hypothetical protein D3C80_1977410 [compost metagenome]